MHSYPEIKAPQYLGPDKSKMTLINVRDYFDWFITVKDERLKILYCEVFGSPQIEFSEQKLLAIYYFFKENIKAIEITEKEIEKEREKIPEPIRKTHKFPDYMFIEPTYSIIFDVSVYFGEMIIKEVVGTKWSVEEDNNLVDYGYPILVKENGHERMCPRWITEVLAQQVFDGKASEDRLVNLYHIHRDSLNGKKRDYLSMIESWSKKKK